MNIIIGSDENGHELKCQLCQALKAYDSINVSDFNEMNYNNLLYPDIAVGVAQEILEGTYERGILICGTGIGMCISANKVPGIRAAVCHDIYSTERSRKSNDVQIMCLGSNIIASELAKALVSIWLDCDFAGLRSTPKVKRINYYDNLFRREV